jgi:DMSO/TMAO reductase YedYZ molybdopterin-dependent catalytic subunit
MSVANPICSASVKPLKGVSAVRHFSLLLRISIIVLLAAYCALAKEPTAVTVRGDVLKSHSWSVDEIKQQFPKEVQNIKFSIHKETPQQTGMGIPLLSLIKAAGPKTEKVPKHHDLTFLVSVEAYDSYRAFFSLAELLPQCGNAQAWLLWEVDGKPLLDKEAPFRLVVLSDAGHDRYIYGIVAINLVDGHKLATRMATGQ